MTETLRLSDVLSRSVSIEWFEAVAIVSDVAERVRVSLGGRSVPELHQIEWGPDGRMSLSGAVETEEPVRRLGQLLQATLVQSDPPVQLRLTASQATAPVAGFGSVREFGEALAYFERPDRQALLRGLYERAAAAPVDAIRETPTLDAIVPLESSRIRQGQAPAAAVRARTRRRAPAIAAAILLFAGGAAYWQFANAAPSTAQVSAVAVKASDVVGTALVSGLSAVTETVGLGRLAPGDATGTVPPATPPVVKAVAKSADAPKSPRRDKQAPPFRLYDLPPVVAAGLPPEPSAPFPAAALPVSPTPEPDLDLDGNVYSAEDPGVAAPIGIRPQLPVGLPEGVTRDRLSQIELLILPDGNVGTVKFLGRPRNVLEGMLLSAAKAWKFSPAIKDGRPVAYRKLVWLVLE